MLLYRSRTKRLSMSGERGVLLLSCQGANAVLWLAFVLAGCRYCDGREDAWEFSAGDVLSP